MPLTSPVPNGGFGQTGSLQSLSAMNNGDKIKAIRFAGSFSQYSPSFLSELFEFQAGAYYDAAAYDRFFRVAVLAHHDDGRLDSGKTG